MISLTPFAFLATYTAERKRNAAKELATMGVKADPVEINGRTIATTAWG